MTETPIGDVLKLVGALEPIDDREAASIAIVLAGIPDLAAPFSESSQPTHVTASALVVGVRGTILHRHRKLGIWVQPGGHIDDGESVANAALREAQEETGLSLSHPPAGPLLAHVDVHPGPNGHTHYDLRYLLLAPDDDPAPGADESQEVLWLDFDAARALGEPSLRGALDKAEALWINHSAAWREKVEAMSNEEHSK
jgi:8-oxo-dGTP pyrophosphatase MutT (NUDIX family)